MLRNSQKPFKTKYANIANKWSNKITPRRNRKNKIIEKKHFDTHIGKKVLFLIDKNQKIW